MRDHTYDHLRYQPSEIEHRYGPQVHILATPYLLTRLALLCAKGTQQPAINDLAGEIYGDLMKAVINAEFPRRQIAAPTRMIDATPRGVFHGEVIDRQTRAVTVNIARAGTLPSMVCYDMLNRILDPRLVRQDHFVMARVTDKDDRVIGAEIAGSKIGGDVDDAVLLFPDPMGATGSSLARAISVYKGEVAGTPRRIINIHLIVTPEYIRRMREEHPDVVVYAARLDRGMSADHVFDHVPGELWSEESGLNEKQYIVPGGGGFGEIMNNAYVETASPETEVDVLFAPEAVAQRVRELALEITAHYRGQELTLLGVLKGSFVFLADLARLVQLPLQVDFLGVSSYGDETETSGTVRITSDLAVPIAGRHVLIVEDIVDTGLTMQFLQATLAARGPASIRICTLLHKPSRMRVDVPLDYIGFRVDDRFVVGYGLDQAERYRNLPFIGVLRRP